MANLKFVNSFTQQLADEVDVSLFSFINWGRELATLPEDISRILTIVSTKQMIASAIAIGVSLERFAQPVTDEYVLSLEQVADLSPGTRLRVTYRESTIVGHFISLSPRKIAVSVNGSREEFGLVSPKNQPVFYSVPDDGPEGIYTYFLPEDASEIARTFASQRAPGIAIIGPRNLLDEELLTEVNAPIFKELFGEDTCNIQEFGRIDGLLEDKLPHYVNVYLSRTEFWNKTDSVRQALEPFRLVLLLGNDTVNELAGHGAFKDKTLIGIIEAADGRNYESAIHQFMGTTQSLYERQIPSFKDGESNFSFSWAWGLEDGIQ